MHLQAAKEVSSCHQFEGLLPRRSVAVFLQIDLHSIDPPLEEQEDAVHDPHDEVWRTTKCPNRGDV